MVKVVLATLNAKYIHSSLGLRYLSKYCHQVAPAITVKEYTINNELLQILGDIYQEQPTVLGLACYIWNIEQTFELVALVRKVMPNTIIVLGGPEVSYDPAALMEQYAAVDYVVLGEGEETLAALLAALAAGRGGASIPGLAWRDGGRVVVNEGPQVVQELDKLPFPYDEADMLALKDRIVYYESSRGCPYACQYCLSSATAGVRFFSLERVCQDLKFFVDHGVRQVKFVDRTFNAKKQHYLPLLKFLAGLDCDTNFHFEIAADILDEEVLDLLRQVPRGRFQFEIGVQSTHQPTLDAIKRNNDWPRIVRHVETVRDYGNIHLHLDLIAGLPYEDYRRFSQSFNDVYDLRPHMLQLGFLKLLKGSGIRRQTVEHGYIFMDNAPYEVLANKYISYGEIRRLKVLEEVFNQVYNSGRFKYTLDWLVKSVFGDAFSCYENLADWWETQQLHLKAHNAKTVFKYLADFCLATDSKNYATALELIKFDSLAWGGGMVRPEFLPWNGDEWADNKAAFWRDEDRVRRYLPDYTFNTWREIKKKFHIEVFSFDVETFVKAGTQNKLPAVFLFDYRNNAVYQQINLKDFMTEEN